MALVISNSVREKLSRKAPPVSEDEILQCFANCVGRFLLDTREEHRTVPPTRWLNDRDQAPSSGVAETMKPAVPCPGGSYEVKRFIMKHNVKIVGTDDAWDRRALGADPNYAAVADSADEPAVYDALNLQPISIRLQKSLIEDFKFIAQLNGLGYQTLMRQVLTRFADSEKKRVLKEAASAFAARQAEAEAEQSPTAAAGR